MRTPLRTAFQWLAPIELGGELRLRPGGGGAWHRGPSMGILQGQAAVFKGSSGVPLVVSPGSALPSESEMEVGRRGSEIPALVRPGIVLRVCTSEQYCILQKGSRGFKEFGNYSEGQQGVMKVFELASSKMPLQSRYSQETWEEAGAKVLGHRGWRPVLRQEPEDVDIARECRLVLGSVKGWPLDASSPPPQLGAA